MNNDLRKAIRISLIISTALIIFYLFFKISILMENNIDVSSWVSLTGTVNETYFLNNSGELVMNEAGGVNNISLIHTIQFFADIFLIFTIYIYGFLRAKRIPTKISIQANNEGLINGANK